MMKRIFVLCVPLALGGVACEDQPDAAAPASSAAVSAASTNAAASATATAPNVPPEVAQSRKLVATFGAELKQALMEGMSGGGPVNAISVCNEKAPKIAESIEVGEGWSIGRTSLKWRNEENAPDDWEKKTLERFEADAKAGKPIDALEAHEVVGGDDGDREFRYMKAIGTAAMCLSCHGPNLGSEVEAALAERYPKDNARGFNAGDIRGAFTVRKRL